MSVGPVGVFTNGFFITRIRHAFVDVNAFSVNILEAREAFTLVRTNGIAAKGIAWAVVGVDQTFINIDAVLSVALETCFALAAE